jgi:hypothetical protein
MATLVSSNVTAPQTGTWPQVMTIVQQFDAPVIVTDDFKLVFYSRSIDRPRVPAEMAVAPIQELPTQLTYTIQISPFAYGRLGVKRMIGSIQDVYGNAVDLKIGDDFDIYNTTFNWYLSNPNLRSQGWDNIDVVPDTAICPGNVAPQVALYSGPGISPMVIPPGLWSGGDFYMWVNYAWLPDRESEGIPFVWEPPFYYSFSQFGIPFNNTKSPFFPPFPTQPESILNNIISAGTQNGWDTCGGWLDQYPNWRGKVQLWLFGNNFFAEGVVPWQFPGVANPTGDLSPFAQPGFPADAQLQCSAEKSFVYNTI